MKQLTRVLLATVSSLLITSISTVYAESSADLVAAALSHKDRPSEEAADDGRRMPLEVLAFAGIESGMAVLELEATSGWYTEILSHTVGPNGKVIMQNPPAFEGFVGDKDNDRAGRLANTSLSITNFDELEPADNSIDLVTWILGPHELWFSPREGVSFGDPGKTFREIARVLKPGGRFLAIDHNALPDSGTEVGGTLHRIREGIINDLAEAAGLRVLRSSNLHVNEDDPMDIGMRDPAIRGKTNKFIVLYEK